MNLIGITSHHRLVKCISDETNYISRFRSLKGTNDFDIFAGILAIYHPRGESPFEEYTTSGSFLPLIFGGQVHFRLRGILGVPITILNL